MTLPYGELRYVFYSRGGSVTRPVPSHREGIKETEPDSFRLRFIKYDHAVL